MTQPRAVPLILNVDDDEGGRYAVSRDLTRGGYQVVEACSGNEALRLTMEHQPDLVLLDVNLPDIDGFEVCRRLKADPGTACIPVLHISASYLDNHSRARGLNIGADGYLTEPVEPTVLNATVKSLLRMKEAEQGLRQTAGQWQVTFNAISDGIAILDRDGSVVRSNRAFDALAAEHGGSAAAVIEALFSGKSGKESLAKMLRSGRRETEDRLLDSKIVRITCDPVTSEGGTVFACVVILSDITEGQRMEEQLRHTHKLESIGLLAGGVAHDFNNLLTGILGNASLALDSDPSPQIALYLQSVVQASERAADLARQLLAYAGKGQYVVRLVELDSVVRDILPLIQAGISRKVDVTLEFEQGLPKVEADASQLRQLMMNLVINGAEAVGDESGVVKVSAGKKYMEGDQVRQNFFSAGNVESGDYVWVRVEDTGCGMDAETRTRIFDPFFTTKFLGRGLGLAAALGIVRQHRGGIRVESAPGAGTMFEVVLPAASPVKETAPTVLVVDDEELVRSTAKTALEKFGYRVVLAENGKEGVDAVSSRPDVFSVVLLDMTMPVMGGAEALDKILALRPQTRVVLTSGYDESEVMKTFSQGKVAGFLQKPFTAGRLELKIRQVLLDQASATLTQRQPS